MSDIHYPAGCKPLTEDLGSDELIRRLKSLSSTMQAMGQEDEFSHQLYVPMALHLTDEFFLSHPSRDVQLLVACCIADVLRVYAPEAPYKDVEQVKGIFNFLISQLNGLRDPKDSAFKRYFYLLENLAYVKSFNMCFEIEDSQDIFCNLFNLMFKIVSDEHNSKVKSYMVDVLSPLITEADNVSTELLNIILVNIIEPNKSTRKNSYNLARDLIKRTQITIEHYISQFFNQVLIMDKPDKTYAISEKVYDLIYELNVICPSMMVMILPQLECKLKAGQEAERIKAVTVLARLFSEEGSQLAKQHGPLWRQFMSRFCDIAVTIRIKCVQSCMHFLLNHPHLRAEIIETLKLRQHDADETVRYEVVMAIVQTAKRNFQIVSESEDLLEYVKERTLDKKFKIRKEAMNGLAMIYKKYLIEETVPEATQKAVLWIKDKILHGYYMTSIEDRLLVERLLITCLVPYQMAPEERMKKLYRLLGTIDENATKAFVELQKNQLKLRKTVSDWIGMHRIKEPSPKIQKEMALKCTAISKQLSDPIKALEYLQKLSTNMRKDSLLLENMETILRRDVSCKECADTMTIVLKKLGQPIMTNLYYNTVKMLLERVASVMVDNESLTILVRLISDCLMENENVIEEVGVSADVVGIRGLKMLSVLAYVFSAHFQDVEIQRHMIGLLSFHSPYVAPYILKSFTYLGRYKSLTDSFPEILEELVPICRNMIVVGTPKQAKHAVRCLFVNMQSAEGHAPTETMENIFGEIIEQLKPNLKAGNHHYRTAIVSLGHIAYNMPTKYTVNIKNIISRKIVKDLLMGECSVKRSTRAPDLTMWKPEEQLSEEIRCKMEGLKTMARWLLGLKNDILSAQKTFRMLCAFIKLKGDLLELGRMSPAEMAWMRLSAGAAMLKICEQKGVGDQFTSEQFYYLSTLMIDPVPEVRERFVKKLHKGLNKGIPNKSLPLDFMGFYVLAGREIHKPQQQLVRTYIETDVTRRRDYVRSSGIEKAMSQLPHIMPDYMLVFSIAVLTHDPNFTNPKDPFQLKALERCLWMILQPLASSRDFFCFGFYKTLLDRLKHHKDTYKGESDHSYNIKMWTICDLAIYLLSTKTTVQDQRDFPLDARIPTMYFTNQPDSFQNYEFYLPTEIYHATSATKKLGIQLPEPQRAAKQKTHTQTTFDDTTEVEHHDEESDTEFSPPTSKRMREDAR